MDPAIRLTLSDLMATQKRTYRISITGTTGRCEILFGETLDNVPKYIPSRVVVLTDRNVFQLYGKRFPDHPVVVVEPGEASKSLDTLGWVYGQLLAHNVDRSYFLLAIGGGMVCDLAGFIASTYMRGLPFGFVSTTLLSQVDASLGGKNGINVSGVKNLVGVFNQPQFVICDTDMLRTLPHSEIRSGLGELFKAALIRDASLFSDLLKQSDTLLQPDPQQMRDLIQRSVMVKKEIVEQDEKETGMRRLLNFGHTFGHPIEMIHGISHGEAVCFGILIANHIAVEEGFLSRSEAQKLNAIFRDLGLVKTMDLDREKIGIAIRKDKKRESDRIHFVLLKSIGEAFIWETDMTRLDTHFRSFPGVGV